MAIRRKELFTTIRTEGGLLPVDILRRIMERDADLGGLNPKDYHLPPNERLNSAVSRSWSRLTAAWKAFQAAREKIPDGERGPLHGMTRERWLLVLFQELGYGHLPRAKDLTIDGKNYPISHMWMNSPIHLVGFRVELDRRTKGVAGAATSSPHGIVQEFLNRSDDHLWGFVSNGLILRILRDNVSLTRQAYIEFDLESMMEGEVYSDFVLLWLLCHQSRVEAEHPEECRLEQWTRTARQKGVRALDSLRSGVEKAISELGRGFLGFPGNGELRDSLRSGELGTQDYYRELLRLVYRFLFLFVAEDRDLLVSPDAQPDAKERYLRFYSTARIRELAGKFRGTRHADLFRGVKLVMEKLGGSGGCPGLGLPPLGSYLWSKDAIPHLADCDIANRDFLEALRSLSFTEEERRLWPVDFKNLGAEELGSVYESLLELHPEIDLDAASFALGTAGGHERKTTGSYYTPTSLITCLLHSALDHVLEEAMKEEDPEEAILRLSVCDPASGSGHFLIAAAHRMAKRLAAVRTGEDEPSPGAVRTALRDVIGRCVYGVDNNPMAVELCKVGLWMESLEPGKPLSFLDHHIRCGNSLIGATPKLLGKGIPDDAFKPIEGDDRRFCREMKKKNRSERTTEQKELFTPSYEPWERLGDFAAGLVSLYDIDDSTIEGVREKQKVYEEAVNSSGYLFGKFRADAWCAAFFWKKRESTDIPYPITEETFRRIEKNPHSAPKWLREEVKRLAEEYRFFHWHLEFPDVFRVESPDGEAENEEAGWSGGFDVVLGNPPWERVKLQEKEWFSSRVPGIANAQNKAARERLIKALKKEDPSFYEAFCDARRRAEGESHFLRNSGKYPLCGRGDINTYIVFAEGMRSIVGTDGSLGCIVPSGIATDDTTKYFFQDIVEKQSLASLYDFENRKGIFPGVHRSYKFCLLTLSGCGKQVSGGIDFFFFAHTTSDLREDERHFSLTGDEIALINPNTRTCPIFRTKRDAEITKYIYRRVPVLINERTGENPWGVKFLRMFDMANDSHLFKTREELEADGWTLEGNVFVKGKDKYLPLYEAKMIHHYNHRFGDYRDLPAGSKSTQLPEVPARRLKDPHYAPLPRYWVSEADVAAKLAHTGWTRRWLLGWRDITNSTNERTVIFSFIPLAGIGNTCPIMITEAKVNYISLMVANNISFVLDFITRQKVGGTHLTYGYLNQIPVLLPQTYDKSNYWESKQVSLATWLLPRVLELTYTAWDLEPFAKDCGWDGPPFVWDEDRRFLIRSELDAAFFHLYLGTEEEWRQKGTPELIACFPSPRDAVDYILDTFPIVRRKDEKKYGEYRTKRVILDMYDRMNEAMKTGKPYRTPLDPPPADPRVAHHPRRTHARHFR